MRTIRINFTDFHSRFNKRNNRFTQILKKYYDIELSQEPEFLFYSCFGAEFQKHENCIRIFHAMENVSPNFNQCDYAVGFDRINFGERYQRLIIEAHREPFVQDMDYFNRKFCNFVHFNDKTIGAKIRIDFCKQLAKYKHIDCPGKVLNNMKNAISPRFEGDFEIGKREFIRDYKFTLAFENAFHPGYITEKIIHALECNSIPIYYGASDIDVDFNPKAFINVADFDNFSEAIEYIKYLDNNERAYLDMLWEPPMRSDYQTPNQSFEDFLLHIIEYGKNFRENSITYLWDSPRKMLSSLQNTINKCVFDPILPEYSKKVATIDLTSYSQHCYEENLSKLFMPFTNQINKLNKLPFVFRNYYACNFSPELADHMVNMLDCIAYFMTTCDSDKCHWQVNEQLQQLYRQIFFTLWPHVNEAVQLHKADAVTQVALTNPGIAVAIGECNSWLQAMATMGFAPQSIGAMQKDSGASPNPTPQDVSHAYQLDPDNGFVKQNIHNQTLRIKLNGEEWELLAAMPPDNLAKFKQIVVNLHGMLDANTLEAKLSILQKLCKTHIPVHLRMDNSGDLAIFTDFLVADCWQVVFLRKDNLEFSRSSETYPLPCDTPTDDTLPDIYIGKFDLITMSGATSATVRSLVSEQPHAAFTLQGRVPILGSCGRQKNGQDVLKRLQFDIDRAMAEFSVKDKEVLVVTSDNALQSFFMARQDLPRLSFATDDLPSPPANKPQAIFFLNDLGKSGLTLRDLQADADIMLMNRIKDFLDPYGLLFLKLPVGPDSLCWLDTRIYGSLLLPRLFQGWTFLASFGACAESFTGAGGEYADTLFVLTPHPLATHAPGNATAGQQLTIRKLASRTGFDRQYYMEKNPDALLSGMDVISHYVIFGADAGKKPAPWFDGVSYKSTLTNIDWREVNPFLHYLELAFANGAYQA